MTIIDGDTLKEAYKNAANIDDREKETAYKMINLALPLLPLPSILNH